MKWFKHNTNAHKSQYCQELFNAFGKSEGYGLFTLFTSFLADKWDGKSEPFFRIRAKELQNFLEISPQKLQKFIKIPTNAEALTIKKDGNFIEINFPKLKKIKDEYSKKSGQKQDENADTLQQEEEEELYINKEQEEEVGTVVEDESSTPRGPIENLKGDDEVETLLLKISQPIQNRWIKLYQDPAWIIKETLRLLTYYDNNPRKAPKTDRGWSTAISGWLSRGWEWKRKKESGQPGSKSDSEMDLGGGWDPS